MLKNNDSYRCTTGIEKSQLNDDDASEHEEYKPNVNGTQNGNQPTKP